VIGSALPGLRGCRDGGRSSIGGRTGPLARGTSGGNVTAESARAAGLAVGALAARTRGALLSASVGRLGAYSGQGTTNARACCALGSTPGISCAVLPYCSFRSPGDPLLATPSERGHCLACIDARAIGALPTCRTLPPVSHPLIGAGRRPFRPTHSVLAAYEHPQSVSEKESRCRHSSCCLSFYRVPSRHQAELHARNSRFEEKTVLSPFLRTNTSIHHALFGLAILCSAPMAVAADRLSVDQTKPASSSNLQVTMEQGSTAPLVHVRDSAAREIASVQFDLEKPGFIEAHYADRSDASGLRVLFQQRLGFVEIQLPDGRAISWMFDSTARQWLLVEGTDDDVSVLGREHFREALRLVGEAGELVTENGRVPDDFEQEPPCDIVTNPNCGTLGGSCTGPSVSGWGYNFRRSISCNNARQDANNKCNNSKCWGCCQTLSCDCQCLPVPGNQGFFCACLVVGVQCG